MEEGVWRRENKGCGGWGNEERVKRVALAEEEGCARGGHGGGAGGRVVDEEGMEEGCGGRGS